MTDRAAPRKAALRPLPSSQPPAALPAAEAFQTGQFPQVRMRRNRRTDWLRAMVAEHKLSVSDLIWPVFVLDGDKAREAVPSMPGVDRLSIPALIDAVGHAGELGIPAVALFPVVPSALKSAQAEEAWRPDNLANRAIRALKDAVPNVGVICDVALDPYTSHGHDGLLEDDEILNDATLEVLVRQALAQADAGVDIVAPSDMMDGRIGRIRQAAIRTRRSLPMPPNTPRPSTVPSAMRSGPKPIWARATSAPIRWTRPMATRPCANARSMSPRAPTCSWSSPACPISIWSGA
jgi:hypothetical protein